MNKKQKYHLLAVLFASLLAPGCDQRNMDRYEVANLPNGILYVKHPNGEGVSVRIVPLEDGTKCAVLIGYKKGSIHCDWQRNQ